MLGLALPTKHQQRASRCPMCSTMVYERAGSMAADALDNLQELLNTAPLQRDRCADQEGRKEIELL